MWRVCVRACVFGQDEVTLETLPSLRAFQLKAFLKKEGLDASGTRAEMVRTCAPACEFVCSVSV